MGAICMIEHSKELQNLVNDAIDKVAKLLSEGVLAILVKMQLINFSLQLSW